MPKKWRRKRHDDGYSSAGQNCVDVEKYFVSSKNVSNFALSKNGELCIVYPFNVQFLRLISMEANYPSAAKM